MAGSYGHIAPPDGRWSLIENMGDAYECVEQLFWLVLSQIGDAKAKRLLEEVYDPMVRGELPIDAALAEVRRRMDEE